MRRVPELMLFLLLAPVLLAQTAPPGEFPIGPADLLDINVLGVADFTREVRVNPEGMIRLPFVGNVKVEGLTPSEVETKLKGFLDPDYVKNPQVSVSVKEPRSRMFTIMGAVTKPGQYQMTERVTLVSAIAGAGGLDITRSADKATIQRSYTPRSGQTGSGVVPVASDNEKQAPGFQIEVDLKKLLTEGSMSLDVPIMPGDFISIPRREVSAIYIIGDVGRPGPFDFPADKGIKISRALAIAGGPTKTSKLNKSALIRQKADGSMERIALDLSKVMKGKAPDIDLQPNDLLYVPSSSVKNVGWAALATLPSSIVSRLILF